jgi:outer membrane protein assembly factor BamB
MIDRYFFPLGLALLGIGTLALAGLASADPPSGSRLNSSTDTDKSSANENWAQWGGTPARNNTPEGSDIAIDWDIGQFDYETGAWDSSGARNIAWVARLGSQSYGNAVVADGRVFIGTNNGNGWLSRYPSEVDLGCLLAFDQKTGQFLWQHSSEKLPIGRVQDWPMVGICCAPLVEGDRLWFVTNRGEVRCLDTAGFEDGENDGPRIDEPFTGQGAADVVWVFDMIEQLGTFPCYMCACSVTAAGDLLFVNSSNGVDTQQHLVAAPDAPSFLVLNKHTGDVVWTDNSPGENILHGQWSSPCYAEIEGEKQVIFAGGDGWVYSFDPAGTAAGKSRLLWKFDANPKTSKWESAGRGTRNIIIATPVIYHGRVYVSTGQDPEYGEGEGHLWCIDPTRRGDVSPELVFKASDPSQPIPPRRLQAADLEQGDLVQANPNSAEIWHYTQIDQNGDGAIEFEETMHRSCGSVAIRDDLLYIADFSGLVHCLNAATGKVHWTYDMLASAWGSPLVVDGKVYIGDEDGDMAIFQHSADPNVAMRVDGDQHVPFYGEPNMGSSVYSTPIVAGGILYISNRTHLFAIAPDSLKKKQPTNDQASP